MILFVGRICLDKGIRELLAAFDRIRADGINAHLLLVGPFDDREREFRPEAVLGREGIHHVDFTDIPEAYMALADVLALPSYREGFGTVVIEAAAMGVPAVGSEIYGLSDAIVDGETGLLVPVRDVSALADTLAVLLRDPLRRVAMGEAARLRCHKLFDSRVVSAAVMAEYRRLLARKET